jgi:beta-N-acetylhexosaminidase
MLYGDIIPSGSLPGTISQSQRLGPSRQHWLVETFNEERDANALDALIKVVVDDSPTNQRPELAGATSNSLILHHPDVIEAHFVVRNSSTQALYGFCATYFFKTTGTGVVGALFVDPARRKLSIGRSLHNRAIRALLLQQGAKRFQLGSRLPSIYLGIPKDHSIERRRLRSWFANMGWNTALSRTLCRMVARNLATWSAPEGMAQSLQSCGASFDLVYGWEYAAQVLDHVKTSDRQGLLELYKLALQDPNTCGIIRAKRPEDGAIIGTVVLYNQSSQLADFIPAIKDIRELAGGISSPVIAPGVGEYSALLQGLIMLGIRQIKQQGCTACVLDYVSAPVVFSRLYSNNETLQMDDGNFDGLSAMGFDVLHRFDEIICDAATFSMQAPS